MKYLSVLFLFILLPLLSFAETSQEYLPNQVIVKYKDGIRAMRSLSAYSNERAIMRAGSMPEYVVDNTFLLQTVDNVTDSIEFLKDDPSIEFVQPNYIYHTRRTPNDKFYGDGYTWGPPSNVRLNYPYKAMNGLNLESAWDIITDAHSITVGVLDTGINFNHEDLSGNILNEGIDTFTSATGSNQGRDDAGHGSHVAGIIGAVGNNEKGIAGVAWRVKLLSLKVLNASGSGTSKELIAGIEYAIKKKVKIINASLGSDFNPTNVGVIYPGEYEVIQRAISNGIVFVAASGNDNRNTDYQPEYPAAFGLRGLISVGASDYQSSRATFNPRESNSKTCYGQTTVHLFAPGDMIQSAKHNAILGDTAYIGMGGTSMATPFISGAVALLLERKPNLTPAQVEMILINSVRASAQLKDYSMSGGVLDVNKLINFNTASLYEPPTNFIINKRVGSNQTVDLEWNSHLGQTEIWVRDGSSGSFVFLDRLPRGVTSYIDRPDTLSKPVNRYYRIRSLKNGVFSPFIRVNLTYNKDGVITSREYASLSAGLVSSDVSTIARYNQPADMSPFIESSTKPFLISNKDSITFGTQPFNSASVTNQFTVTNIGSSSTFIGVINTNKNNFDIDSSSTCLNYATTTLPIGGACNITIRFTPESIGSINGNLTVTSDNNTLLIPLNGIATDSRIDGKVFISLSTVDFLKKLINRYSLSEDITVSNIGGKEIIVDISFAPDGFAYSSTSTCVAGSNKLSPSGSCILAIQFNPLEVKSYNTSINFQSSVGDSVALTLKGAGVISLPDSGVKTIVSNPISPISNNNKTKPKSSGIGGCSVGNGEIDYIFILIFLTLIVYSYKIILRGRRNN